MIFRNVSCLTIVLLIAHTANAENYKWNDSAHGCLVKNAFTVSVDGARRDTWTSAPGTLFLKLTDCSKYVGSSDLENGGDPIAGGQWNKEQEAVNNCYRAADEHEVRLEDLQLIQVEGIQFFGVTAPRYKYDTSNVPVMSKSGWSYLLDVNGAVYFNRYFTNSSAMDHEIDKGWAAINAQCTPLDK